MAWFPSARDVGDLLGLGIHIEPEQKELLDAPGGRPMLAVWSVPDPTDEMGGPYFINGRAVVLPMVLTNCLPTEHWSGETTLSDVLGNITLQDPMVIGELVEDSRFRTGLFQVADEHYGRQVFDLWPIEEREVPIFQDACRQAMDNSGYTELVAYLDWENGNDSPNEGDEDYIDAVYSTVLDQYGQLKNYDEFIFRLDLPEEQRFTWERLQDLSQQGWTAYGMALPKDDRKRFFNISGSTPWF